MTALAERLDALRAAGEALITEGERLLIVSRLATRDVQDIAARLGDLAWSFEVHDEQEEVWELPQLQDEFGPFAIHADKPLSDHGAARVVTNAALAAWLSDERAFSHWEVARLVHPIRTLGAVFAPWGQAQVFVPSTPLKPPRELVKESGPIRRVPADIRPWLLDPANVPDLENATVGVWANAAATFLIRALSNEIDEATGGLRFRGPPRVRLSAPDGEVLAVLESNGFEALQSAARWAFDNVRDAEVKQSLLAMEIARAAVGRDRPSEAFRDVIDGAFESAKIAYQLSLADISRDSLKALSELRKAIGEEVGKVSDTTRQIVTSAVGSVAVSAGMVAARITANVNEGLLLAVSLVAFGYVCVTAYSGYQYLEIQKELRSNWRNRLYNFIADSEYQKMVQQPMSKASKSYYIVAGSSVAVCLAFLIAIFCISNA